jgi:hypothetical protein
MKWKGERPVQIQFEALGTTMRGQMLHLTATTARIEPDRQCVLFNKTRTTVRFRFEDLVYTLGGMAISCECDDSITLHFDDVTKKDMTLMRSLGLVPSDPTHAHVAHEPLVPHKRTKAEQRRVRREHPPNGVERRIQTRHELEAPVKVVVMEHGHVWNCTLLEISKTGCRLFSDTPFEIPPEAKVEVEFVGLGYPFRLVADIKVKKDEHILGLHFQAMSSRCKDRLIDLTSELAEKSAASAA